MGVYSRFKRGPEGFRALVELLETTPLERRQRMIDVGRQEDPEFTERALQHMLTFEDLLGLPDVEMAELMAEAPGRLVAHAIGQLSPDKQVIFIRNAKGKTLAQLREHLEDQVTLREVGGAQLKVIEFARKLEKRGLIRIKRLPT
jgi:flagellar motor switch protein FliG